MKNLLRTFTLNLALLASTPAAALAQTAEEERVVKDLIPANSANTMRGDWRIEGKELVQLGKTPTTLFFGNKNWGDFNLEVDCKRDAGPEGFMVLFRAVDARNYHSFALGSYAATYHEVFRVQDGDWIRRVAPLPMKWEQDLWCKIRVEARGELFKCYLDGRLLFEFSDSRFPLGQVGLGTWNASVRFRNIKVASADGKTILWEGLPANKSVKKDQLGGGASSLPVIIPPDKLPRVATPPVYSPPLFDPSGLGAAPQTLVPDAKNARQEVEVQILEVQRNIERAQADVDRSQVDIQFWARTVQDGEEALRNAKTNTQLILIGGALAGSRSKMAQAEQFRSVAEIYLNSQRDALVRLRQALIRLPDAAPPTTIPPKLISPPGTGPAF